MGDFKREERYIVVKIKDLTPHQRVALQSHLEVHGTPTRECVVVEPDWPIYEIVWHLVERLATGQRLPFMTDDDPDKLKAERDALAAHVERLRDALKHLRHNAYHSGAEMGLALEVADDALSEPQLTSLARLKAQWCEQHAKRFMELADNARTNGYAAHADGVDEMAQELKDEAAELRRQAEGDE